MIKIGIVVLLQIFTQELLFVSGPEAFVNFVGTATRYHGEIERGGKLLVRILAG